MIVTAMLNQIFQMWSLELQRSISGHDVRDRTGLLRLALLTARPVYTRMCIVFYRNELSVWIAT